MNKILFDKMAAIVEKHIKNYKTDFYETDIKIIDKYEYDEFFWIVRESGTQFLNINHLKYINSCDYTALMYFKNYKNAHLYRINIKTLKIEKLNYSKTFDLIESELETPTSIDLLINNKTYSTSTEEYAKYGFIYTLIDKFKLDKNITIEKTNYIF